MLARHLAKPTLVTGALLMALSAAPVAAKSPRDAIFPNDQGCYLRDYSLGHLVKHPDQQVRQIAIGASEGDAQMVIVTVAVYVRNNQERYVGTAYCENEAGHLFCGMEGDAGAFTLEPAKDGAVMLKVARRGMAFEGAVGFVELSGVTGDDRSFLIPDVPADACP